MPKMIKSRAALWRPLEQPINKECYLQSIAATPSVSSLSTILTEVFKGKQFKENLKLPTNVNYSKAPCAPVVYVNLSRTIYYCI